MAGAGGGGRGGGRGGEDMRCTGMGQPERREPARRPRAVSVPYDAARQDGTSRRGRSGQDATRPTRHDVARRGTARHATTRRGAGPKAAQPARRRRSYGAHVWSPRFWASGSEVPRVVLVVVDVAVVVVMVVIVVLCVVVVCVVVCVCSGVCVCV